MSNEPAEPNPVPPAAGDEFGRAVATIAVAQICESTGFHTTRRSALDALADLTIRYISDLGRAANFHAGFSGRSESNVFDIAQALEDLGAGAAAEVLGKIARYVSLNEDVPFARPLPTFPISQNVKQTPSFAKTAEAPAGKHIPDWLPAFPDLHTYVHTPVWNERVVDPRAEKMEQARQRRKAEKSLLSLQKRLACNVDGLPHPASSSNGAETAVPVTLGVVDTEERFPVFEAFAAAIDAAKDARVQSGMDERRVPVLPSRAKVLFRFGIDKKSVAVPLAALGVKNDVLFLRDDEKDDKKRRAEMILKEAMENPDELIQL